MLKHSSGGFQIVTEKSHDPSGEGLSPTTHRVSVIIPVFDLGQYLEEAIRSVIDQTFQNWEVFLIDDGSTDESLSIIKRYAEQYPDKIFFATHPDNKNRGASASRNLGLSLAHGNLVAFLDADDIWLPDKLEKQVRILEDHPEVGLVIARVAYFCGDSKAPEETHEQSFKDMSEGIWKSPKLLAKFISDFELTPCPTSTLIRREVLDSVGGWEDSFRMNFTDQVLFAKINALFDTYVQPDIVALYRQHENSSWALGHRTGRFYDSQQAFWNWLLTFVGALPKDLAKEITPTVQAGLHRSIAERYSYLGMGRFEARLLAYWEMTKTLNDHWWLLNKAVRRVKTCLQR